MTIDEICRLMDHAKAIGCPHVKVTDGGGVEFVIPRGRPAPISQPAPSHAQVPDEERIPMPPDRDVEAK